MAIKVIGEETEEKMSQMVQLVEKSSSFDDDDDDFLSQANNWL